MTNVTEEGLDKEGKEILDELEKEGFEIAGRAPAAPETPPVTPEVPPVVEPKPPVEAPKEPKTPEVTPPPPAPDRKVQHVPLPKYLETETKLKEAQAKIEELTKAGSKTDAATITEATDAVKELVEKFGYEQEDAKKLVDVFKHLIPGQTVSPEMQRAMEALPMLDKMKAELEQKQEAIAFDSDFTTTVLNKFPHLDKYKDQIKQMAYSETYAKTPLKTVALEFMDQEGISPTAPKTVTTSEKSGGGTSHVEDSEIDFSNITDEQFSKLSPADQDKFFAYQDSKEKKARGALN